MISPVLLTLALSAAAPDAALHPAAPAITAPAPVRRTLPSEVRWLVSQTTRAWFSLALAGFALAGSLLAGSGGLLVGAVGSRFTRQETVATDVLLGLAGLSAVGSVLSLLGALAATALGTGWFITDLFN
ncbi:MAG: hypothetical protein HY904_13075 [Deltaproteobacteria bacterium]|nr:hypothetical protein [Deltaproteobacteria bacterium]